MIIFISSPFLKLGILEPGPFFGISSELEPELIQNFQACIPVVIHREVVARGGTHSIHNTQHMQTAQTLQLHIEASQVKKMPQRSKRSMIALRNRPSDSKKFQRVEVLSDEIYDMDDDDISGFRTEGDDDSDDEALLIRDEFDDLTGGMGGEIIQGLSDQIKLWRVKGNNCGVRGAGTSERTYYRNQASTSKTDNAAKLCQRIKTFFSTPASSDGGPASSDVLLVESDALKVSEVEEFLEFPVRIVSGANEAPLETSEGAIATATATTAAVESTDADEILDDNDYMGIIDDDFLEDKV